MRGGGRLTDLAELTGQGCVAVVSPLCGEFCVVSARPHHRPYLSGVSLSIINTTTNSQFQPQTHLNNQQIIEDGRHSQEDEVPEGRD